jgi:hypothetical protein
MRGPVAIPVILVLGCALILEAAVAQNAPLKPADDALGAKAAPQMVPPIKRVRPIQRAAPSPRKPAKAARRTACKRGETFVPKLKQCQKRPGKKKATKKGTKAR